jgi:prepilin-type N-terminal cleavage/methylation domain-containing protein
MKRIKKIIKKMKLKTPSLKVSRGFTLLEVVAAIFILTLGLGASFSLIQQTMAVASIVESKLTAVYLAQEGIEIIRNVRDTNWLEQRVGLNSWDDGLTDCDPCCEGDYKTDTSPSLTLNNLLQCDYDQLHFLDINEDGFYSYATSGSFVQTKFKRKITIDNTEPGKAKISVEVKWMERGKFYNIEVCEDITNWYER